MTREHIASHLLTDLSKSHFQSLFRVPIHTGFWHMSYWFNSLKSTDNWCSWCKQPVIQLFLKSWWN